MSNSYAEEDSPFIVGGEESSYPLWMRILVFLLVLWLIYLYFTAQGTWKTSEWSKCSAVCDGGSQTREVTCNSKNCDPNLKPIDFQKCGTEPCWSKTESLGGTGGKEFEYNCPAGEYVNEISYRSGDGLDSIGVKCTNNKNAATNAVSNLYGGSGGNPGSFNFPEGIGSFYVTGNSLVGNITPGTELSPNTTKGGKAVGVFAGSTKQLSCPANSKIAGIYGKSGSLVDMLGFNCYKFA